MLRKACLALILAGIAFSIVACSGLLSGGPFRKVDNGIANIIFSDAKIQTGRETKVILKNAFTSKERIYSRIYFPGSLGFLKKNEKAMIVLWIDGRQEGNSVDISGMDPSWDQLQQDIYNTAENESVLIDNACLGALPPGTHKIKVEVVRTISKGEERRQDPDGTWKTVGVFDRRCLSAGEFMFTVE
jgi:hypothetical protein